ncbi:hypothetical protein D3C71_29770 [compost metagenome]
MEILMFSDPGKFELIDFQMSHYELLLRSYAHGKRDYNIDILFKGVYSLNMITSYKGLTISAIPKEDNYLILNSSEKYIFKLTNLEGISTYIDAAAFGVFHNKQQFGETSLGDFMWSEYNKQQYWSANDERFIDAFIRKS